MKDALRAFFTDAEGRVVVGQWPNVPIIGWVVLWAASLLIDDARWHDVLSFFSGAFLFTWAYLELTQGVNSFRRVLGAVVIVGMLVSRLLWDYG